MYESCDDETPSVWCVETRDRWLVVVREKGERRGWGRPRPGRAGPRAETARPHSSETRRSA